MTFASEFAFVFWAQYKLLVIINLKDQEFRKLLRGAGLRPHHRYTCIVFLVGSDGAGSLKARFENMATSSADDDRKRGEEEKARRLAREQKEKEESKKREEVVFYVK